jgi:hypothetical protein
MPDEPEDPPSGSAVDVAMHNDPRLLRALIRVLEEKQIIASGEIEAMAQRTFEEMVAANKDAHREKLKLGARKCVEELEKPNLSEQDRTYRKNLLAYYEGELAK